MEDLKECYDENGMIRDFDSWYETDEAKSLVTNAQIDFKLNQIDTKILFWGWYQREVLGKPEPEPVEPPEIITEPIKGVHIYDNIIDYTLENPLKLANSNLDSFRYLGQNDELLSGDAIDLNNIKDRFQEIV